jgi:hypothetical protein
MSIIDFFPEMPESVKSDFQVLDRMPLGEVFTIEHICQIAFSYNESSKIPAKGKGVYIFATNGEISYIGKAKDIVSRVRQHIQVIETLLKHRQKFELTGELLNLNFVMEQVCIPYAVQNCHQVMSLYLMQGKEITINAFKISGKGIFDNSAYLMYEDLLINTIKPPLNGYGNFSYDSRSDTVENRRQQTIFKSINWGI